MGQIGIEFPPVHSDLLSFVDGADQQTNADRQQLDIREGDADVAGDDQPFIENAVQNIDQIGVAGYGREAFHPVRR